MESCNGCKHRECNTVMEVLECINCKRAYCDEFPTKKHMPDLFEQEDVRVLGIEAQVYKK